MSNNIKDKNKILPNGHIKTNPIRLMQKEESNNKRHQYLKTRKSQSLADQIDVNFMANGQLNIQNKTVSHVIENNNYIKVSDTTKSLAEKNLFKLKSELLEYKTKCEKLQNEINVYITNKGS
jgi:DNA recombination-dependent growth factor C